MRTSQIRAFPPWALIAVLALALAALSATGPTDAAQQTGQQQGQQQGTATHPHGQTGMMASCQEMMAHREKMMAQMREADQRLDSLVAEMKAASGQQKIDATAAVVAEMVEQRRTMRERMNGMHERMMAHMGEHMQGGMESMAACPMMKEMRRQPLAP